MNFSGNFTICFQFCWIILILKLKLICIHNTKYSIQGHMTQWLCFAYYWIFFIGFYYFFVATLCRIETTINLFLNLNLNLVLESHSTFLLHAAKGIAEPICPTSQWGDKKWGQLQSFLRRVQMRQYFCNSRGLLKADKSFYICGLEKRLVCKLFSRKNMKETKLFLFSRAFSSIWKRGNVFFCIFQMFSCHS